MSSFAAVDFDLDLPERRRRRSSSELSELSESEYRLLRRDEDDFLCLDDDDFLLRRRSSSESDSVSDARRLRDDVGFLCREEDDFLSLRWLALDRRSSSAGQQIVGTEGGEGWTGDALFDRPLGGGRPDDKVHVVPSLPAPEIESNATVSLSFRARGGEGGTILCKEVSSSGLGRSSEPSWRPCSRSCRHLPLPSTSSPIATLLLAVTTSSLTTVPSSVATVACSSRGVAARAVVLLLPVRGRRGRGLVASVGRRRPSFASVVVVPSPVGWFVPVPPRVAVVWASVVPVVASRGRRSVVEGRKVVVRGRVSPVPEAVSEVLFAVCVCWSVACDILCGWDELLTGRVDRHLRQRWGRCWACRQACRRRSQA